MNFNNICLNCMKICNTSDKNGKCLYCGKVKNSPQELPFLPKKTMIDEKYLLGNGLEANGESLSYIGYDTVNNNKIFVKEFFPKNLCTREIDFKEVKVLPFYKSIYDKLLLEFQKYYKSLARFRGVKTMPLIYDIVSENNTTFVIFEWIDGQTLENFVKNNEILSWDETKRIFFPLLSALTELHASNIFHFGICPQNIIITPSKRVKITGFAIPGLRKSNSEIECKFYEGATALEQYSDLYELGESTDVYSVAATIFFALSGELPPSALKRKISDNLLMAKEIVKTLPSHVVSALAMGLRIYPNNRILSCERLKIELNGTVLKKIENSNDFDDKKVKTKKKQDKGSKLARILFFCSLGLTVVTISTVIICYQFKFNKNQIVDDDLIQNEEIQKDSSHVNKIRVPILIDKKFDTVLNESYSDNKYKIIKISEEFNDKIEKGRITSQSPDFGEEMFEGGTIAVNVSKGPKNTILPEIDGKTLSEVSTMLVDLKLVPKAIREFNNDVPEGVAIGYKNNKAGDSVESNAEVTILVSKGRK